MTYPPKYYITILKTDIATEEKYIRNWERIENIFFLRNKSIKDDDFLRLFLFNNTILKIKLDYDEYSLSTEQAKKKIDDTI